jgi:hypothetical protein
VEIPHIGAERLTTRYRTPMRTRSLLPLIAGVSVLALPAVALADDTATTAASTTTTTTPTTTTPVTTPTTTTPTTTTPAPDPEPVIPRGTIAFGPQNVNGDRRAVLAGDVYTAAGTTSIYRPNQYVTVRIMHGKKRVTSKKVKILQSGKKGVFRAHFRAVGAGRMTVSAVKPATDEQLLLKARPFHVEVLKRGVSAGEKSFTVRLLQTMLKKKGYVIGESGVYDARTQRAVQAFRKMVGIARTFSANEDVFARLQAGQGGFKVRFPSHGRHVEGDLTHQILALIGSGGKVERLYTMSSGKPSTPTVLGSYRVYMREPGTNSHGMVYSSYFIRGYAIHGYAEVPPYPASHGCLRVPVPDAVPIWNWIGGTGTPVDVYYR